MAWKTLSDPSISQTKGTTGIIENHYDCMAWESRLQRELVNAKIHNADGFSVRNALRQPGLPEPPQRALPKPGQGLDLSSLGWSPQSKIAKELHDSIDKKDSVPADIYALPETTQHSHGWVLGSCTSSKFPKRTRSVPVLADAGKTAIAANCDVVREAAATRSRRRNAKLASAEASIEQAMSRTSLYLNAGVHGKKYHRPTGETDATSYERHFIEYTGGLALHQTKPPYQPKSGVPEWK